MKTSDPLSDLLARISNGLTAGHDKVDVPASRVKEAVLKVLEEEGFIASFRRVEEKGRPVHFVVAGREAVRDAGQQIAQGIARFHRLALFIHQEAFRTPGMYPWLAF